MRGWPAWPGSSASTSRWRRSRPGRPPAGRSTRSSPVRPGTGWTLSRERRRQRWHCGRRACWRCSGIRPPPAGVGGLRRGQPTTCCPARRSAGEVRPGRVLSAGTNAADGMRQAGAFSGAEQWRFDWQRPYTRDEWLDRGAYLRRLQRVPAGQAGGVAGRHWRRHRGGGGQLHDGLHRGSCHRGTHLTADPAGDPPCSRSIRGAIGERRESENLAPAGQGRRLTIEWIAQL